METLRLLVTELVSNSVRHARAETVVLKVLVGRTAVLTEVTDEGPGLRPGRDRRARDATSSGWGLFLVERLAHRWGVNQEPTPPPRSGSSCGAASTGQPQLLLARRAPGRSRRAEALAPPSARRRRGCC